MEISAPEVMLDVWELRGRGWTEFMIKKLLGEPDWISSGWGNQSKKAYRAILVEAVEAGSLFRDEFSASAKRRRLDQGFVGEVLTRSLELELLGAIARWPDQKETMRHAKEKELEELRLQHKLPRRAKRRPATPPSELVCCVDIKTMFDDFSIDIRFMRHEGIDRIFCDGYPSAKAERETVGSASESVAMLLPEVLSTLMRYGAPLKFVSPGLVDGRSFAKIVDELALRSAKIREGNLEQSTAAIVTTASSLSLKPEPSSDAANLWDANCPGTHHRLLLNTSRNEFWCGYCNRGGDPGVLRSFADERER